MIITVGVPRENREEAAALYWDAFGEKLGFMLGPKQKALEFILSVLRADHGICAHDEEGNLLGIAGFKSPQGALVGGTFRDLCETYGWASACVRSVFLAALERDVENERFLMDGIFVAEPARGKGVGTALLDAIASEAKNRGYTQVRLDVVDSNPRAKALYQHIGFKEVKTVKTGLFKYIVKFNAATTMVLDL